MYLFKNKIIFNFVIFLATKKSKTPIFSSSLLYPRSQIRDPGSGMDKFQDPGSG
jgi:hypothetical protein